MSYVDGFLAAVPSANREAYEAFAVRSAEFFKSLGAIEFVECWGDDIPDGEVTSFPMAVKAQHDETVVMSWIIWPSRDVRMRAYERMQEDSAMEEMMKDMPFDGKRIVFGGFERIVDLKFDLADAEPA